MFLEAAYFQPIGIAATGRKLGILSDARYRFERGIDPRVGALGRGGGDAADPRTVRRRGERDHLERRHAELAAELHAARRPREDADGDRRAARSDTADILGKLGFAVTGSGPWTAAVPSWRPDIVGEADLVEEVTRVCGFDSIPTTSLPRLSATSRPVRTPLQRRVPQARRALAARGMNEAVTWSFMARAKAERFGAQQQADLRLLNSIDATLDTMRPSILPNLIDAAARNEARGLGDPALFEVGPQYKDATPTGQARVAAGLRHNMAIPRNWARPCPHRRRLRRQGRRDGRAGARSARRSRT